MESEITLQQGLDLFRKQNSNYFSDKPISEESKQFLLNHDIAHVLFNCNTSIYGEGIVKIWTTFGTDISFRRLFECYRAINAFELSRAYSFNHVAKNIIRLIVTIPKAILRAKQMNKPWTFENYQPYLNKPISAIRKEFNIKVIE